MIGQHSRSDSVKRAASAPVCSLLPLSCKSNDHSNRGEAPQIGCLTVCPLGKEDHATQTEQSLY